MLKLSDLSISSMLAAIEASSSISSTRMADSSEIKIFYPNAG